jgi:uncharacterized repeat protein (TIGR03803 family)
MVLTPQTVSVIRRVHHAMLQASIRGRSLLLSPAGIALLAISFLGQLSCPAQAATFQDIYNFYQTPGNNPAGGLTIGKDWNLYGTTFAGGQYGFGTVFKITPGGTLTTLANFSGGTNDIPGGAGAHPRGTMVQDNAGNLYGITYSGTPGQSSRSRWRAH